MSKFSEHKLLKALAIFRRDQKMVEGLWVEKQSGSKANRQRDRDYMGLNIAYDDEVVGHKAAGNQHNDDQELLIDFFEDNMLEEVTSGSSKSDIVISRSSQDKADKGESESDHRNLQSNTDSEDLGIIDLDMQDGGSQDDFEDVDDDKLPVLKNIYSKKNRPNNSKSVAIGSRS